MGEGKRPPIEEVEGFLIGHHAAPVTALSAIDGGFWSSAYAYQCGNDRLVLRLAHEAEGYCMDQAAWDFGGPDLPIPEVLAIGEAFDGAFAISRRAEGRFLEDVRPDERGRVGPMLDGLLAALRDAGDGEEVDLVQHGCARGNDLARLVGSGDGRRPATRGERVAPEARCRS